MRTGSVSMRVRVTHRSKIAEQRSERLVCITLSPEHARSSPSLTLTALGQWIHSGTTNARFHRNIDHCYGSMPATSTLNIMLPADARAKHCDASLTPRGRGPLATAGSRSLKNRRQVEDPCPCAFARKPA